MDSNPEQDPSIGNGITSTLTLSKAEEEVLRQYDRLQEIKLEIALAKAQQSYSAGKMTLAQACCMGPKHQKLDPY